MLTVDKLRGYQADAVEFQCSRPGSALWLDMGLGKTVITLTSIAYLIRSGQLNAVIVVAPIRVARLVWRQEALKWSHTSHLRFSMVMGSKDQRVRALLQPADVYLVNYENLRWLNDTINVYFRKKGKPLPIDGIAFDEVSLCKNSGTERVKSLMKSFPHFKWRTGLTGTPAGEGYKDLHGQYLVLDGGARLGTSKVKFMTDFYRSEGYKQVPYPDTADRIKQLIADMTMEMTAAEHNPLPDLVVNDIEVDLPAKVREKYDMLERELFVKLDSGESIEVINKVGLLPKLFQFSNGAVYLAPGEPAYEDIHDAKIEALEDIIEESAGSPILCAYSFRSDAERIMKRFAHIDPINLTSCKTERSLLDAMTRWKSGNCRLMIGHPASMGHGIDGLQDAGNILVWFGLTWSHSQLCQFNARLSRQGQNKPVICHRIICRDTADYLQLAMLTDKGETQDDLRAALSKYRKERGM